MWVYDALASAFQEVCDSADDVDVTIEVHQNSPVDNSWSAVMIHEMIDRENFGINPDIGNVVWTYDVPEEDYDAVHRRFGADLEVLALQKTCIASTTRRISGACSSECRWRDGDIDYRYAISAMANAGYSGYMAIEGHATGRSVAQRTAVHWNTPKVSGQNLRIEGRFPDLSTSAKRQWR